VARHFPVLVTAHWKYESEKLLEKSTFVRVSVDILLCYALYVWYCSIFSYIT